jgi:hypothetical protein
MCPTSAAALVPRQSHPARHDVDELGPGRHDGVRRAGLRERRGDISRRTALVPQQGERRVGKGEPGADRDGLRNAHRRRTAPQHLVEAQVARARRGRTGRRQVYEVK